MCKHVAAVLYGIGRRLDEHSELLFTLRGVDPTDLIGSDFEAPKAADELASDDLGSIFGIDVDLDEAVQIKDPEGKTEGGRLEATANADSAPRTFPRQKKISGREKGEGRKKAESGGKKKAPVSAKNIASGPFNEAKPTGEGIRALRKLAGLSQRRFAEILDVSTTTIGNWESSKNIPQGIFRQRLQDFQRELLRGPSKKA